MVPILVHQIEDSRGHATKNGKEAEREMQNSMSSGHSGRLNFSWNRSEAANRFGLSNFIDQCFDIYWKLTCLFENHNKGWFPDAITGGYPTLFEALFCHYRI